MDCAGRELVAIFISYDPRLPDNLSIFIRRYLRDENMIASIRYEVRKLQAEIQATLEKLRAIK
jgi:hypothetical protein